LRRGLEKEPSNNRYRFYLAETLRNLGRAHESVFFHEQSFCYARWDEEKAWSAYRCAEYYVGRSDYEKAKEWCLKGLSAHGGFAEHAWLMSWVLYQEASYKQSIYWARIAKAIVETEKDPLLNRIGFRYVHAYQDGPSEVEKWARIHI
jgi:tetratricopeptide (TPR) repeat protein